jgi:hypothetical protein
VTERQFCAVAQIQSQNASFRITTNAPLNLPTCDATCDQPGFGVQAGKAHELSHDLQATNRLLYCQYFDFERTSTLHAATLDKMFENVRVRGWAGKSTLQFKHNSEIK